MEISQSDLRNAAARHNLVRSHGPRAGQRVAFLCHSHKDRQLALGLQQMLAESGLDLYIDWQDASMPDNPNATTAARLRERIVDCELFLFLATENSMASRWCPWELGYADGKKPTEKIGIVPTRSGSTTHGNEYLGLYRHIEVANNGALGIFSPHQSNGALVKSW